ncbi:hypothetical protein QTJ16_005451 [Diplocarpon rosae]|uniref:Autophagy protein 5 n=1 Tax=Diplocarpon rosae TaxID=946125 RepID=A0AAD9WB77_9HELO|nr:hypothetical protein QTJ16_005451 [Diplocarpon rosae]
MSMSKENTNALWNSVQDNDLPAYLKISSILLNPPTPLRNIPLRIYIPTSPTSSSPLASIKIVQTLVPPRNENGEALTLGSALNAALPSLFPSRRDAIVAEPILHGAAVPFRAPLEDLMRRLVMPMAGCI